jgi:hypothetical protein
VSFGFWRRWLQCVSVASGLVGLLFLIRPEARLLGAYNRQVIAAFHDAGGPSAVAHQQWAIAVVGSAMLGWSVLMTWVATVPFARRERGAWQAIGLSVVTWAVGDSIVSYRAGIPLEVVFNSVVVALVALPLAMTYRDVFGRAASDRGVPAVTGRADGRPIGRELR